MLAGYYVLISWPWILLIAALIAVSLIVVNLKRKK
jgi:hypothetical protein